MPVNPRHQRILIALENGTLKWDELKRRSGYGDEPLGFLLGELLDLRKIWTVERNDVRIYGLEKRLGLVPRLHHENRRLTDSSQ